MSETTQVATVETIVSSTPKSVIQRANRKRFSFGPVWNASVVAGTATDFAKLVEQAVKLQAGSRSDLQKLKLATLRDTVAAKLQAEATPAVTSTTEATVVEATPTVTLAAETASA